MPEPNRRDRRSPDDLAKQIAERLAASGEAKPASFSLRNSVVVGRLISGFAIVALAGGLAFAVTIGVNWFMERSTAAAEVVPIYPDGGDGQAMSSSDGTVAANVAGIAFAASSTTSLPGPFAPVTTTTWGLIATLPPPATDGASPGVSDSTSTSTVVSTGQPPTTRPTPTTVATPTTTPSAPTSTLPTATTTLPATTSTTPTPTTTIATTTTTQPVTTTTAASTTTSRGTTPPTTCPPACPPNPP